MPILISNFKAFVLRMFLGVYLLWTFFSIFPETSHVFSYEGMFKAYQYPLGFNILSLMDDFSMKAYLVVMAILSVVMMIRWLPWYGFLFLAYGWFCFMSRIPYYVNPPNVSYLGYLLLCLCFVEKKARGYEIPKNLYWGMWLVFALSYTVSGVGKVVSSDVWQKGESLNVLLNLSFIAKDYWLVDLVKQVPELIKAFTYFTVVAEAGFILFVFNRYTRFIAWMAMTMVHLGILLLLKIDSIPLGMLVFHWMMISFPFKSSQERKLVYNPNSKWQTYLMRFIKKEDINNTIEVHQGSGWASENHRGFLATLKLLSHTNDLWRFWPWK